MSDRSVQVNDFVQIIQESNFINNYRIESIQPLKDYIEISLVSPINVNDQQDLVIFDENRHIIK